MAKNQLFLDIRPIVDIEFTGTKHPLELFMHDTLRSILKLQHEKIHAIIDHIEGFKKEKCSTNDDVQNFNYIKDFLGKNNGIKQQLIGCIIGIFTENELKYFLENKKEISKRITEMVIVRYLSTID